MEEFKKNLNSYFMRNLCLNPCFTQFQRKFIKDLFYITDKEFIKSDFASMKNFNATVLTNCIKDEYKRLIKSDSKYTGFSSIRFKPNPSYKDKHPQTTYDEIHRHMINYYNNIILPVLNERGDFTPYLNYKLKQLELKA